jgi:hypothetical protein
MPWKICNDIPSMATEDIVGERERARKIVQILENAGAMRTREKDRELTAMRLYVRELMKEAGKRFVQERLFQ